jgi:hypothetical protein
MLVYCQHDRDALFRYTRQIGVNLPAICCAAFYRLLEVNDSRVCEDHNIHPRMKMI